MVGIATANAIEAFAVEFRRIRYLISDTNRAKCRAFYGHRSICDHNVARRRSMGAAGAHGW